MNVAGIDHLVLYVDDVDASSSFYGDLFDAETGEYGPGRQSVYLGRAKLNFRPVEEGPGALVAAAPSTGAGDFCLVVEDPLEDVIDRLERRGVDLVEGPVEREGARGAMTSVYFRDPDGNLVEVSNYAG